MELELHKNIYYYTESSRGELSGTAWLLCNAKIRIGSVRFRPCDRVIEAVVPFRHQGKRRECYIRITDLLEETQIRLRYQLRLRLVVYNPNPAVEKVRPFPCLRVVWRNPKEVPSKAKVV